MACILTFLTHIVAVNFVFKRLAKNRCRCWKKTGKTVQAAWELEKTGGLVPHFLHRSSLGTLGSSR